MIRSIDQAKAVKVFIIGTFVALYLLVSVISTIHVIDFFRMSNPNWLAISLAIAFEIGAAASLASIIALQKMNKGIVWLLFIILTLMQAMGNTYYAYTHIQDFQGWVELFGLNEEEIIFQKRILSLVSGAILPIVALGFIKSLVDYIKPEDAVEVVREEIIKAEIEALEEKLADEAPTQPESEKKTSQGRPVLTPNPVTTTTEPFDPFRMESTVRPTTTNMGTTKLSREVMTQPQIDNKKSEALVKSPKADDVLSKNGRL
jgi:hypothetical protein